MDTRDARLLPRLFWRRYRCGRCSRLFELPLDDPTPPVHAPRGATSGVCDGRDTEPA